MNKNKLTLSIFALGLMMGGTVMLNSCISDDLNDPIHKISKEDLEGDNYGLGAFFLPMTDLVVPAQENHYQMAENLVGDIYGRYMMYTNDGWNAAKNPPLCNVPSDWYSSPFNYMAEFYAAYNEVKKQTEEKGTNYAWAQILKVSFMQRLTDTYGPIPYKSINSTSLTVAYDSQEDVYRAMFDDLNAAIEVLTSYVQANPGAAPMAKYDNVYAGNFSQWVKYANSLKLRMALRISKALPDYAREQAESAVKHSLGVITSNSDNASYYYEKGNPINVMWNSYGDARMCADILCYMNGYKDKRLEKYMQKHTGDWSTVEYAAIPSGVYVDLQTNTKKYSAPNIMKTDRLMWLNAAEVAFCRAEGGLLGWNVGDGGSVADPETFYNQGIQLSFEQWNASGVADYIEDATSVPDKYVDPAGKHRTMDAPSTMTVKWSESANDSEKLERIMIQKWIALYPLGQEAWSEIRRTGFPKVFNLPNQANDNIETVPNRLPFSYNEYLNNKTNTENAVGLLGGEDNFATKLWWQKGN